MAYVETTTRHSDNGDLDSELSNLSFNATHKDASSKTTLKVSYVQLNSNTVDARSPALSHRNVFTAGAEHEHEMELSAKAFIQFGLDRVDTDYDLPSCTDRINTKIPLRLYYEMPPQG
ncbi:MAG: hypothetical protein J6386_18035 [Candidatus Synoicihabitans palmerolidicus]|nr:hypothetical protein [Candidatus Synoicihabitans palmerolidicus]